MNNLEKLFHGKRVTVMGLGLLGRGVGDAAFLARHGAQLTVTDLKTVSELSASLKLLKKFKNIEYTLGEHKLSDFEDRDFILKSAGVPRESPFIKHAEKNKVPVYMSTALFARHSEAAIIGITGTRGKTTLTHMLFEIFQAHYKNKKNKVYIGGNIRGVATLPLLEKTKKGDIAVLELDSWQLQGFGDFKISPHLSVFTTFMPDHLNYYKNNLAAYFKDKSYIYKYQKKGDILIVGSQAAQAIAKYDKIPKNSKIVDPSILSKNLKINLPGEHNAYNASLAYAAAQEYRVPESTIKKALTKFKGVSGRLERVGTIKSVSIYNDTTATTPAALAVALESLGKNKNISLIMGGSDKGINLSQLKKLLKEKCAWISLLQGNGTERLIKEKIIDKEVPYKIYDTFMDAVKESLKRAPINGTVLLSPGFASFGMFKNEYDRGEQFNTLVKKIKR